VGDQADGHIFVDARTGILHQIAAEHVHRLANQVSQADHAQKASGTPQKGILGQALVFWSAWVNRVNQLPQEDGSGCITGAGKAHDQERASQSQSMAPGN
jgi:hypothetical protein